MNAVRVLVMVAIMLFFPGGVFAADPFDEAIEAHNKGNYEKAFHMFKQSAEDGSMKAMYNIGQMFLIGEGTPQSYTEAMKWYRKAAELGDVDAMFNIGLMYKKGDGIPQSYTEAMKWYRKAAELGSAYAMNNIGVMYKVGEGVTQDFVQAHKWYNLAAAGGNENGRKNRDALAKKMTPVQIAQAQKLAAEWKPAGKQ